MRELFTGDFGRRCYLRDHLYFTTLSNPDKLQIVTGWLLLFDAMFLVASTHTWAGLLFEHCQKRDEQLQGGGRLLLGLTHSIYISYACNGVNIVLKEGVNNSTGYVSTYWYALAILISGEVNVPPAATHIRSQGNICCRRAFFSLATAVPFAPAGVSPNFQGCQSMQLCWRQWRDADCT